MKSSEILRKAARRVEAGANTYSCCAIAEAHRNHYDALLAYSCLWGRFPTESDFMGECFDTPEDDARNHRVVALCLAAAIAEDKGD